MFEVLAMAFSCYLNSGPLKTNFTYSSPALEHQKLKSLYTSYDDTENNLRVTHNFSLFKS